MFGFCAFAACIPAHAEALKDRSLMPPVSVTMQACVCLPAGLAALPAPLFAGGLPHAATASTRPPTTSAPYNLIPRAWRKTDLLPHGTAVRGALRSSALYAWLRLVGASAAADLLGSYWAVTRRPPTL